MEISEIPSLFSKLLGSECSNTYPIRKGRNSQVFKILSESSGEYVLKIYSRDPSDKRDRVGVEFRALTFLWDRGVKCVPKPIAVDYDLKVAVYEFIDGCNFEPSSISSGDIDDALDFLVSIRETQSHEYASAIPWASEACFSVADLLRNVNSRLNNLDSTSVISTEVDALKHYIHTEFSPFLKLVIDNHQSTFDGNVRLFRESPPCEECVLSPSDFGFHNAIKRREEIVFLDFEYFGWDDSAKTLSDFLLHPAMQLTPINRARFAERFLVEFKNTGDIYSRFKVLYPFYGLKWCLILLNEFMPNNLAKRHLVGAIAGQNDDILAKQLSKSKNMLERVKREYEYFPY